ncbi:amino acid adenylation domain-containing protein [Streptomyces sp. NPDC046862]|uniref:amino acid adenylation domain-containing protein n=1 Tax=Streptomyces sp. NPDC046862 TaxID=3154603 RepID=UPI0034531230
MAPDTSAIFPTSFAQERLWIIDRLAPGTSAYHVPVALRLRGAVDVRALAGALSLVVERHEALRTVFGQIEGQTVQRVLPAGPVPVEVRHVPGGQAGLAELLRAEAALGFSVDKGPLLRATLFRLADDDHVLTVVLHHLVSDGWSMSVLLAELSAAYNAQRAGSAPDLPELPLQYVDFAIWQRDQLTADRERELLTYWRETLAGAPDALDLPADRPRPPLQSHTGAQIDVGLPAGLSARVTALANTHRVSPFMVLLAAWGAMLGRFTGTEDVVIGTAVGNRDAQTEQLIGCFINTLPLRVRLEGDPTFAELLGRVRATTLSALQHQDLPFDRLVQDLAPRRDLSRNPLVPVLLTVQNAPAPSVALDGLDVVPVTVDRGGAQCDLSIQLRQSGDVYEGFLEYATDLFDAATLRRWWSHLTTLLEAAVAGPDIRLSELPCLTAQEIEQVTVEWNRTTRGFHDTLLHEIVDRQATATPDAPALVWDGGTLDYAAYTRRAREVAAVLRGHGVGPEVTVAVLAERDADLMVAVLGVLQAGGAYVPVNTDYPPDRIAAVLDDARPAVVVTQRRLADRLPAGLPVVLVDDLPEIPSPVSGRAPTTANLAYVIYTSGSTGRPKGVMVQHRSAADMLAWHQRRYPIGPGDVVLQKTPTSFDVSVPELFWWAAAGARLALPPAGAEKDPYALLASIRRHGVTVVNFVPSMFGPFLDLLESDPALVAHAASLRYVFCAGEALPVEHVRRFHRVFGAAGPLLANLYGPTEITVYASAFDCPDGVQRVPIGTPCDNTGLYVLDRYGRPQPIGIPGELCIGGEGVTRGYLDRPALTAERFVPHPLAGTRPEIPAGARLYRTGDLARHNADGTVEWRGRLDNQVKVRGFRVELGEITVALRTHPQIAEAVVVLRDGRLAAYYVPTAGPDPTVTELRAFLRRTLPDPMIPDSFTGLSALPLSANGKADTSALPEPDGARPALGSVYRPPATALEKVVAGIWTDVLRVDPIGVQDDFFDLGGNSLLATQVASGLRETLGVEVPLRVMFEAPTVAAQAGLVRAAGRAAGLDPAAIAEVFLEVRDLSDEQVSELLAAQEGRG